MARRGGRDGVGLRGSVKGTYLRPGPSAVMQISLPQASGAASALTPTRPGSWAQHPTHSSLHLPLRRREEALVLTSRALCVPFCCYSLLCPGLPRNRAPTGQGMALPRSKDGPDVRREHFGLGPP